MSVSTSFVIQLLSAHLPLIPRVRFVYFVYPTRLKPMAQLELACPRRVPASNVVCLFRYLRHRIERLCRSRYATAAGPRPVRIHPACMQPAVCQHQASLFPCKNSLCRCHMRAAAHKKRCCHKGYDGRAGGREPSWRSATLIIRDSHYIVVIYSFIPLYPSIRHFPAA